MTMEEKKMELAYLNLLMSKNERTGNASQVIQDYYEQSETDRLLTLETIKRNNLPQLKRQRVNMQAGIEKLDVEIAAMEE